MRLSVEYQSLPQHSFSVSAYFFSHALTRRILDRDDKLYTFELQRL